MPLSLRHMPTGTPPEGSIGPSAAWFSNPSVLLFTILTAQLMVVLDTTIVNVALPHIQRALGFSDSGLSWVLNAYILTFGGLLLLGARAGDLLGRRRVFLLGIGLFTMSSLVGGLATAEWMLLAARAAQGVGASLAAPSALSLLTTTFAEGQARVRAIGLYTTVSAAGGAVGLVAGGLLTDLVSWRWVMFVNVPIGLAVWLVGRRSIAETSRRHGRFDLAGSLTSTGGMTAIVFGLVEAGSTGWGSLLSFGSLAGGTVLLVAFVLHERRAKEPVLPLRLFANANRNVSNLARALLYAAMFGLFFFLTQFFQEVQGFTPLVAGFAFLPMPASVFLSSQFTGRVLVRRLPQKTVMVLGASAVTAGLLLATLIGPSTSYPQIVVTMLFTGWGMGISFVSLTSAALAEVAPEDAGAASGLVNVSQQLGAAVGLAVLVTVFDTLTRHAHLGSGPLSRARSVAVDATLTHALDDVFRVGAILTATAIVIITWLVRTSRAEAADIQEPEPVEITDHPLYLEQEASERAALAPGPRWRG